jgi:hypothetical protein
MSEFIVRAVEVTSVDPNECRIKALRAVDFVPAQSDLKYAPVPEVFVYMDGYNWEGEERSRMMFSWTENTLRRMDKLGIMFPVSASLHGPILLPSIENASEFVPVWYTTKLDLRSIAKLVKVGPLVDELMTGVLPDATLSYEDRRFIAWHHKAKTAEYGRAVKARLREGVPESELVKWDV